jgi:hypothetical protein
VYNSENVWNLTPTLLGRFFSSDIKRKTLKSIFASVVKLITRLPNFLKK